MNRTTDILAKNNSLRYAFTKLAEELMALGEVLLKMVNKKPENQPPMQDLIDEMGDVTIRMAVLARKLDIDEAITERIKMKSAKLEKYLEVYSEVSTTSS